MNYKDKTFAVEELRGLQEGIGTIAYIVDIPDVQALLGAAVGNLLAAAGIIRHTPVTEEDPRPLR